MLPMEVGMGATKCVPVEKEGLLFPEIFTSQKSIFYRWKTYEEINLKDQLALSCDMVGLRYIPNKIPTDVEKLSLQGTVRNKFEYLFNYSFKLPKSWKFQTLPKGNEFVVVEQNIFSDLKSTKILELSRSKIETVSKTSFRGLENLEELDLNLNRFTGIGIGLQNFSKYKKTYYPVDIKIWPW